MARWIKILSEVRCSTCEYTETIRMPKYATKTSFECTRCKCVMTPRHHSCCIFCSYGSVPCPRQQSKARILSLQENEGADY